MVECSETENQSDGKHCSVTPDEILENVPDEEKFTEILLKLELNILFPIKKFVDDFATLYIFHVS